MTERITFSMPDEMAENINSQLSYGDNRSEWIRDAIREKLERDTSERREPPTPTDPFADLEFPSGRDRQACYNAIRAAESFIREEESATMRQIVMGVQPEHTVEYDVVELEEGDRYRGSWWRKIVKPGLEALETVEKPSGGEREWRWVG